MSIYTYRCVDCNRQEQIIGGLDDSVALCTCGGLMLRLDDPFEPKTVCAWCSLEQGGPLVSHGICDKHAAELLAEAEAL